MWLEHPPDCSTVPLNWTLIHSQRVFHKQNATVMLNVYILLQGVADLNSRIVTKACQPLGCTGRYNSTLIAPQFYKLSVLPADG